MFNDVDGQNQIKLLCKRPWIMQIPLLKKPLWLYAAVSAFAVLIMALASAVWAPQLQQWEERLASRTWSLASPDATERRVVVVV